MEELANAKTELTGSTAARTPRDLQRIVLRDLVALARESATTEEQIQRRHQTAVEQANKDLQRFTWDIQQRHKSARETAQQDQQNRQGQIEAQFKAEMEALAANDKAGRKRVEQERHTTDREIKHKYDQAVWLAESVLEAAQNQLREEGKKANEEYEKQLGGLGSLEQQAGRLVVMYRQDPRELEALAGELPAAAGAAGAFEEKRQAVEGHLRKLARLDVPRLFVGVRPYLTFFLVCVVSAAVTQFMLSTSELQVRAIIVALGVSIAVMSLLTTGLWFISKSHVRRAYAPLRAALAEARAAAQKQLEELAAQREVQHKEATEKRDAEVQVAKDKFTPLLQQSGRLRDAAMSSLQAEYLKQTARLEGQREQALKEGEERLARVLQEAQQRHDRELQALRERHQRQLTEAQQQHDEARAALERRLREGLTSIQAPMDAPGTEGQRVLDWSDPAWRDWVPPRQFASLVRFGELKVNLNQIADGVARNEKRQLALPEAFSVPVTLGFPRQASLLIQTDRAGREQAIRTLQLVMIRLLTMLPAGRVRFTIFDPVGLGQNFAGFMHLADHDEALVGGRIWTDSEHIEQRLQDLTEHMETVIQKYLRNEFETIDDYNAQAGELAEPYRFLVIADYPAGFEGDAYRRLESIASTGARCGVYTLVLRDTRQPLPSGVHQEELEAFGINLVHDGEKFVWKDEVFGQFPLALDEPPSEDFQTRILDVVGRHAKDAKRVEVAFNTIAPTPEQFWSAKSAEDLRVPVGRMGATRLQALRLGRGVAQHALIAGKTGSGKSTLLHVLVTNLAMWYSPDEVEFYLVDFKKGVEFKAYATHTLPHARAIAVESDREFGLSVLQRLDAELSRRGTLYRKLGVQELSAYRQASGQPMPRTLLIIDEFQEFFSEDDKIAQDASLLLDRLVRQGRAFGIHVLLGSQTIGGTSGLSRSTIGQMAVRISLQCSEADSQLILGDNNSAARLLTRPGEAIYNDAGGLVEANSPFQVSWLPDDERDIYLKRIINLAQAGTMRREAPIVFEGNAPADVTKNALLARALAAPGAPVVGNAPLAWIGDPVAIKDPTAVAFRRQSGANLLMVGQQEEGALAVLLTALISLAAQHAEDGAVFYVLDGTPADSPLAGKLAGLEGIVPQAMRLIEYRAVPEAMEELARELEHRQSGEEANPPSIYVFINGLQRYRVLRHQEESFSFSSDEGEKKPQPDKVFADLLREGPALGMHVLAWSDTAASIERTLDRNSVREFDNRVLFQMSASDSSNLIDSPLANKLGFHRALAYSEEQGVMEKFRPYAMPEKEWMESVGAKLGRG